MSVTETKPVGSGEFREAEIEAQNVVHEIERIFDTGKDIGFRVSRLTSFHPGDGMDTISLEQDVEIFRTDSEGDFVYRTTNAPSDHELLHTTWLQDRIYGEERDWSTIFYDRITTDDNYVVSGSLQSGGKPADFTHPHDGKTHAQSDEDFYQAWTGFRDWLAYQLSEPDRICTTTWHEPISHMIALPKVPGEMLHQSTLKITSVRPLGSDSDPNEDDGYSARFLSMNDQGEILEEIIAVRADDVALHIVAKAHDPEEVISMEPASKDVIERFAEALKQERLLLDS